MVHSLGSHFIVLRQHVVNNNYSFFPLYYRVTILSSLTTGSPEDGMWRVPRWKRGRLFFHVSVSLGRLGPCGTSWGCTLTEEWLWSPVWEPGGSIPWLSLWNRVDEASQTLLESGKYFIITVDSSRWLGKVAASVGKDCPEWKWNQRRSVKKINGID